MPYYIKRTKAKKKDKPLPLFDKAGVTIKKKPDLKAKLDKEFSLFIRLRDCMPNGYFRCISCGQIKPFGQADCGHYFSRTHLATRFDENNCHAECRHCLTPDHKVLMQDLTWKLLGEIKNGDKLFAFDEERTHGNFRRYKVATATSVQRDIQDVYEVELENGDKIKTTANHK
ncbi:MAG: recombination protein NinG [Bacteroides sp.]|nr:recombination protein NinG [Bacteroides sp.]